MIYLFGFNKKVQEEPREVVYKLFLKSLQYSQKTPAVESFFNKVVGLTVCNYIKKSY